MSITHKLRPYQTDLQRGIFDAWGEPDVTNVLAVSATGSGKCLGRDTPVLMFDGTTRMVQDVKPGDVLMGPDSKARFVKSTTRGIENLWRVIPKKGEPFVVNESHILSLKMTRSCNSVTTPDGIRVVAGDIVNLTVSDYLTGSKTFKHCAKTWRTAINFPEQSSSFPMPPYILGVWLGDGTARAPHITTGDVEIFHEFSTYADSIGSRLNIVSNSPGSFLMQLGSSAKTGRHGREGSPMGNALRELQVLGNKHIPHIYKVASRKDRLEMLAGILDSDGYFVGKGYSLTFKSARLMDDTIFLARSLGFSCTKHPTMKRCCNNGVVGLYWRCDINGPVDEIPCRVERNKSGPRRQKKDVLMTGFSLEPMGPGDYFGFEILGPDRLFVLGDFTVTHNTVVMSAVISLIQGGVCAIAHRGELVVQISLALAREGIRHRIIGSTPTARACSAEHMVQLGQDYVSPTSRVAVASVDTLIRMDPNDPWFRSVALWVLDEAHHLVRKNKWHRAVLMFTHARGLGFTATPCRADGQGLGAHADGVFHRMILAPDMRWMIVNGYLTHYRVIGKPSNIDLTGVTIAADGDYSRPKLSVARAKSTITGDIVKHYLSYAPGKQGITFDVDVAAATATAATFRQWGVSAEVVHGDTPDELRRSIIGRYRRRELLQMVNVDLFGEGFDVPRCSVASMGRPTQSYPLFKQQFGRPLRPDPDDPDKIAIIIDHVGNVDPVHGLPDAYREETLDRRERRSSSAPSDAIPTTTCTRVVPAPCGAVYERFHKKCPYCGWVREIANRSGPEFVDGDLTEIDPAVLDRMRGEQIRIDGPAYMPAGVDGPTRSVIMRRHAERQTAQNALRSTIATWSGWMNRDDTTDLAVHYRKFYYRYGLDVQTAQTLGTQDAVSLKAKIDDDLRKRGVAI